MGVESYGGRCGRADAVRFRRAGLWREEVQTREAGPRCGAVIEAAVLDAPRATQAHVS